MEPLETIRALVAFERRGPGTDAERRAARWLAGELIAQRLRVRIETFWCRPNWALAHAWHVLLALVGSLLAPSHPIMGAILLGVALVSILMDELAGISPGRRLTPERASQNVVARAPAPQTETNDTKATLVITANYDAGRTALVYRDAFRRPSGALKRLAGKAALGWLAWLSIAFVWLLAVAIIRATVHHSTTVLGVLQLPPTVALVLALAVLLEAAAASYGPAANDNASGIALALTLARALADRRHENLALELVLTGAGEGGDIGIRRHLRSHKRRLTRASTVVLGIAPCGEGHVHYWVSDGRLIPLPYARPLRELAANSGRAAPNRGRGSTPALAARALGLPAIAIGCLDERSLPPRSHHPTDTEATIDQNAVDHTLKFALQLVDAINVSFTPPEPSPTPA